MRASNRNSSRVIENLWRWLQRQPRLVRSGLLIAIYILLGLALEAVANYYRSSFQVQPWDPASGLSIAFLFGFGLRYIPVVFLVPFLENALFPVSEVFQLAEAAASVYLCLGYGVTVALLLHKADIDPRLRKLRDVVWFTIAFVAASLVVSGLDITTVQLLMQSSWSGWFQKWMHEWAGEATGIMMLAPLLLIGMRAFPWANKRLTLRGAPELNFNAWSRKELLEWILLIAFTIVFTWAAYGGLKSQSIEYSYLTFVPIIWIAARYGFEKTTLITLIVNISAVLFVGGGSQGPDILALQFGLMTVTFTGALLSTFVKDRQQEIVRRRDLENKLRYDAIHDNLTGLYNRNWLWHKLQQAIERQETNDKMPFALLFLDLDRFKDVNDSLGHLVGDHMLLALGERLVNYVPEAATVFRFGGDEFIVLLTPDQTLSGVEQLAQQLFDALSQKYVVDEYEIFTTVSIGIVLGSADYDNPEAVLRDADIALYEAKARGKAQYVVFNHQMYESVVRRSQLENDLRQAIQDLEGEQSA